MLTSLKNILKRTPWGQQYSRHRMRKQFWEWTLRDETAKSFYQQFIKPGDIVIDVGANRGNRTKLFLKLGATTVLVEPQISCAQYLKIVLRDASHWILVEKALGSGEGEMDMFISTDEVLSTLSPRWLSTVQRSGRFAQSEWNKRQKTPVTTLDEIIRHHGNPSFIKIDVEGYEREVLSGLSVAPQAVSFEFTPECIEETFACMDHLLSLAEFEFQLSLGESMRFELNSWLSGRDLKNYISTCEAILSRQCFGDIYARKIG